MSWSANVTPDLVNPKDAKMMRRNSTDAVKVVAAAALIAVLGATILFAKASGEDDRPPIIVHNGSLIFDGGEITPPPGGTTPKRPTHSWSKDAFLGEWKPSDHWKGVRALEVTFRDAPSPSACAASTMSGEDVLIDYRVTPDGPPVVMRVHLRRKHLIFKREPKIDSNGKALVLREPTSSPPAPPRLVYEDGAQGWISKVTVDDTACEFARPLTEPARLAFRVRIQPKAH